MNKGNKIVRETIYLQLATITKKKNAFTMSQIKKRVMLYVALPMLIFICKWLHYIFKERNDNNEIEGEKYKIGTILAVRWWGLSHRRSHTARL